jgi:hypothetical protein
VREVHVLVPDGIDDPRRPSGGNVYDRRVCCGLMALGWSVHEYAVAGQWPRPDVAARLAVGAALARVPDGEAVLVDGLLASVVPEVVAPEADRLRLVVLLHMPRNDAREVAALSAASAIVATSDWTRRWLGDPRERARLCVAARSRRLTLSDWVQTSRELAAVLSEVTG